MINGPATANYDVDLGNLFLNDWSHSTADVEYLSAELNGPPTLDNGLINGTNVYGDLGSRFNVTFTAGTSYRIRLVNAAIDTHFKFTIDNHNLTVISADFVPIVPYDTQVVSLGMGERYDVVVTASETSGNYWLRAIAQIACSENAYPDNIMGTVMYDSTNTTEPDSTAWTYTDNCDDETLTDLVPYLALDASSATVTDDEAVTIGVVATDIGNVGYVSLTPFPSSSRDSEADIPYQSGIWAAPHSSSTGLTQLSNKSSTAPTSPPKTMLFKLMMQTSGCTS